MCAWKPSEAGSQMGDKAKAAELASEQGCPGVARSPTPAWAWSIPAPGFFSTLRAAQS